MAADIDWAKVHTTCTEAMNELYNLRFPEAEKKTNEVIALAPGDPRGYFFKAMTYYYWDMFDQGSGKTTTYIAKFYAAVTNVEKVCDQLLEQNEKDSKAKFYKGGIIGYRGLVRYKNDELLSAVWDGKKAYDLLSEALEDDPQNTDAQFGLGLFNYLLSQAPSAVQSAIKLAGLKGDKIQGLKQMENAAANGIYTRSEAHRWLSDFYPGLEPYKARTAAHLKIISDQYPQNWWFRQSLANFYLYSLRRATDAIPHYEKLAQIAPQARWVQPKEISLVAWSGLGTAWFYKNKFDEAAKYFQKILNENFNENALAQANWRLGMIMEMKGERTKAIGYYEKAQDKIADAKASLQKQMTSQDVEAQKIENLFRSGDDDGTIAAAEAIYTTQNNLSADIKGYIMFYCARSYQEKQNWLKAEQRYWQAIKDKPTTEKWIVPYSYWRLAQVQRKQANTQAAKQNLEMAKSFSGFDGEKYLKNQVAKELDTLE